MVLNNTLEKRIACIIVTYNRKQLLKRCLNSVVSQTSKPEVVYIMDNASTDGTMNSVKEWGYYECERNGVHFKYIQNERNEGGAGGFYLGLKTAYEDDSYDAFWVMDDDGAPDKNCLKILQSYLSQYDYIAPLVISTESEETLAFTCHDIVDKSEVLDKYAKDGLIKSYACPFNGILYSSKLIQKIGYPKREMFIWGDEQNYHVRAKKAGFYPVTVVEAIHHHPKDRQVKTTGLFGGEIVEIDSKWKWFCFSRNKIYNWILQYGRAKATIYMIKFYVKYTWYFIKKRNLEFFLIMNESLYKGYTSNFSGLEKYFK